MWLEDGGPSDSGSNEARRAGWPAAAHSGGAGGQASFDGCR